MFRRILILSLLACLACSCIKEKTGDCASGVRLQFRYTHNPAGQDLLAARVGDMRVYLFDRTTELLVRVIRVGREDIARGWMRVEIPRGDYRAVAWAGSGGDLLAEGYHEARMADPLTGECIPQAEIGEATLGDFRMALTTLDLPVGSVGEVAPREESFCDLFFAAADVLSDNAQSRTVLFDFIKNTSTLRVRVTGLEHLAPVPALGQPLHVFITGPNERYLCDNSICLNTRQVRYEPPCTSLTPSAMEIDIRIQRLVIDYHTASPVLLYLRDPASGGDMITPLDVTDAILRALDAQGNPLWPTQREVDREDEFPFEISIRQDLSVSITVEGFEIVDAPPLIGRD